MRVLFVGTALAVAVAGAAQAAEPLQADPAKTPFMNVLRLRDAEVRAAEGVLKRNQALVSIPVEYRRTGVLKEDVKGRGLFALGTVYAPAGSPGYWAGNFGATMVAGTQRPSELWCLFPKAADGKFGSACFLDRGSDIKSVDIAAVVTGAFNPFLVQSFSLQQMPNYANAPRMDEKPVTIVPDLRIDFVFLEWDTKDADFRVDVGGGWAGGFSTPRAADGSVTVTTPAGEFKLTQPDPADRHTVTLTRVSTPAPAQAATAAPAAAAAAPPKPIDPAVKAKLEAALDRMAATPETLLRAASAVEPDPRPRAITPGTVILSQDVRAGAAMRQVTSPQDRGRFGPPGAPLFPVKVGERTFACWRQAEVAGDKFYGVKGHCLDDADGKPGYEILWKDVAFVASSNVVVRDIATRSVLKEPVEVKPAPDHAWSPERLEVRYLGGANEARDAAGVLRPRAVRFSVGIGRTPQAVQEWRVVAVDLDAGGRGVLELGGGAVAEVQVLEAGGAATVRRLAGWSATDAPARDPAAIARQVRTALDRAASEQPPATP